MNSSCSRILLASQVKSLSEDKIQNPSTEPECSRSMASMVRKPSVAFLPAVKAIWCCVWMYAGVPVLAGFVIHKCKSKA